MINVSTYWTLPPSRQGKIRAKVEKVEQDMQRVVGHYTIWMETSNWEVEFSLYCSKCWNSHKWVSEEYTSITKEEYLDKNHEMSGQNCDRCKEPLA